MNSVPDLHEGSYGSRDTDIVRERQLPDRSGGASRSMGADSSQPGPKAYRDSVEGEDVEVNGHFDQEFLEQRDDIESPAEVMQKRRSYTSPWKLILLLLLVVVTVFTLSFVALGAPPGLSHSDSGSHDQEADHGHDHGLSDDDDDDHTDDVADDHNHDDSLDDADHDVAEVVHHHEDVPNTPTLRKTSEYVLDMAWDFQAAPRTREYHWTITDAELNPDGVYRPMMLINNQFPGPLVECDEGDTIIVNVDNQAVNATAIHFHGLFQNGTNDMDGTVGITQCAIAPGSSFTYQFKVQGQAGTYWYHAHHSAQASDGLLGPVVIHNKDERTLQELDYATDRIVMLQDHYHNTTAELLMDYLKPGMENDEPVPDNALINGRGQRDCEDFPGWHCDSSDTSTALFDLAKGQRHRLRFINVGAFAEFQVQFDEHPFYITEVDGTDVHPEPFHRLNILPAQRYSVVLETNVTTAEQYWMRARMVTHCFTTKNPRLQEEIRAIVHYSSDGDSADQKAIPEPSSEEWPEAIEVICKDLNTSLLHPVVHQPAPPADDFVILRANFMIGAWRLARGFFNESTWLMNATYPTLHRFLDAAPGDAKVEASQDGAIAINDLAFNPENEFVLQTEGIRTIDISINNFDDGAHPFHLHGHKFFVLVQGTSGYPPSTATELSQVIDEQRSWPGAVDPLENPLRRDTVTVEGYAWAVIRVVFDNPGLWALHCHNTWHSESGMVMQLLVRGEIMREGAVSQEQRDMCLREGVERGVRPDDSIWFGQF